MATDLAVHRFHPVGAAMDLFNSRDPEILLSGPAGTGKSRACLEKLNAVMLKYPDSRGIILRKTRESLGSTALVTYRQHVAKEALATGLVNFYGGSAEEPPQYRYANGSTIMIGGMDKATKIMSSEYDMAYVQEAIELTPTDWESITTRLRNGVVPYQQLIADTNPDRPTHWLNQRVSSGATRMMESRHQDNPRLYRDGVLTAPGAAYMAKLGALTGVRRQRLLQGLWVAADGLIYEGYDPAIHLRDQQDTPPPAAWPRMWTVDFGFTNPFVCQMWAIDPDGRMHLYREIYQTQQLVEDHAKVMLAHMDVRPTKIVCDHDAEGRATLERHLGMSTVAAKKTVTDGIEACAARLKVQSDGLPRVVFYRDAVVQRDPKLVSAGKPTCTIDEVTGYIWDQGTGKAPKESPLKVDDHGMDAWRYGTMEQDLGQRPRYRSFRY